MSQRFLLVHFIATCVPFFLFLTLEKHHPPSGTPHTSMRMRLLPEFCTLKTKKDMFDGVAIEDGDDGAGETSERAYWVEQEQQQAHQVSHPSPPLALLLPRHNLVLDLFVRGSWMHEPIFLRIGTAPDDLLGIGIAASSVAAPVQASPLLCLAGLLRQRYASIRVLTVSGTPPK